MKDIKQKIGSDVAEVAPSQGPIQTLSAMCSKMCICLSLYHCAVEFQCVLTIYLSMKKVFYHAYSGNGINRTVLTCLQM